MLSWQLGCKVPKRERTETTNVSVELKSQVYKSITVCFCTNIKNYKSSVPENVPENTPGAWLTKLSIIAPGLRDREGVLQWPDVFAVQLACGRHDKKY